MSMPQEVEQVVISIRDNIKDIPNRFKANEEAINELDLETQDLMHLMEFRDLDIQRGFKIYKELQLIRKKRRELKNENELLLPAIKVCGELNKKSHELDRAIGKIRKIKSAQNNRQYHFRIRKDLESVWDGASSNK